MKKIVMVLLAALMLFSLVACSSPVSGGTISSDKPRITSPDVSATDLAKLVSGNNEFAFDLYRQLKNGDDNFFYSPYSISLALAMTYAGARTETEQQMADTLRFALQQDSLHPALNALALELAQRGEGAAGKDGEGFRLNIINAIWGQQDYEFLADFLDVLAENYGAGLRTLDFIKEPEKARITINDWVSDETEERIKDLLPQGSIDTLTRLVLTNAIYFNAAWLHPFNEDMTNNQAFHLLDGSTVNVPMMVQMETLGYTTGDGYVAVELPYDGNELAMLIILPDSAEFMEFENSLDSDRVNEITDSIQYQNITITMPLFKYDSSFSLKETLANMGMPAAFSENADFSGINGQHDLMITDVFHKAFVSVNEAGTEAAAATAVVVGLTSAHADPVAVSVDHPFIYLIHDIETGSILFAGRVMNPND